MRDSLSLLNQAFKCDLIGRMGRWNAIGEYLAQGQPMLIPKSEFAQPIATEAEAFEWLRAVSRFLTTKLSSSQPAEAQSQMPTRIFVEGRLLQKDFAPFLVQPSDRSFAAYIRRVTETSGGERFGIAINDIQIVSQELWARARELATTYKGFAGNRDIVRVSAFLGNYPRSGFGVHLDEHHRHVLQYGVTGNKRMRFWSRAFVSSHPKAHRQFLSASDYDGFIGDSITLDGSAGDWLCWPGTYWHVGETIRDEAHYSLSFVFENVETYTLEKIAARGFCRSVAELCKSAPHGDAFPDEGTASSQIHELVDEVQRALQSQRFRNEVTGQILTEWMSKTTGGNFRHYPEPKTDMRVGLEERVMLAEDIEVAFTSHAGEILYAANGHVWRAAGSDALADFFRSINSSRTPFSVRGAASTFPIAEEELRDIVSNLASVSAVTPAPDPSD